jgi:PPOX class probable F420-dependent enzyme
VSGRVDIVRTMASIDDPGVRALLDGANHAVVSTINEDGSVHSTVVWQEAVDGRLIINSALGRRWPTNLLRDPRVTAVVYAQDDPYNYVMIRGTATGTTAGADAQISRLAKKYTGSGDFDNPGEERIMFLVDPLQVTHHS